MKSQPRLKLCWRLPKLQASWKPRLWWELLKVTFRTQTITQFCSDLREFFCRLIVVTVELILQIVSKCHFSLLVFSDCCIAKLHLLKGFLFVLIDGFFQVGSSHLSTAGSLEEPTCWIHGPWSVHPKLWRFHGFTAAGWTGMLVAGGFLIDFGIRGRHAMLAVLALLRPYLVPPSPDNSWEQYRGCWRYWKGKGLRGDWTFYQMNHGGWTPGRHLRCFQSVILIFTAYPYCLHTYSKAFLFPHSSHIQMVVLPTVKRRT